MSESSLRSITSGDGDEIDIEDDRGDDGSSGNR